MNEENNDTHKTLNTVSVLVPVSGINRTVADRLADEDEKKQQQLSTSLPLYYYNDDRVSTRTDCFIFFSIFIWADNCGIAEPVSLYIHIYI